MSRLAGKTFRHLTGDAAFRVGLRLAAGGPPTVRLDPRSIRRISPASTFAFADAGPAGPLAGLRQPIQSPGLPMMLAAPLTEREAVAQMNDTHRFIAGVIGDIGSHPALKIPSNFWREVFRRHHPSILIPISPDDYIETLRTHGSRLTNWREVIEPALKSFPFPVVSAGGRGQPVATGAGAAGSGPPPAGRDAPIVRIRALLEEAIADLETAGRRPPRLDVWLEVARRYAGKGEDADVSPRLVAGILEKRRLLVESWPPPLKRYAVTMMDLVEDAVAELKTAAPPPKTRTGALSSVTLRLAFTNFTTLEELLRRLGKNPQNAQRLKAVQAALDRFRIKGPTPVADPVERLSDDECATFVDAVLNADTRAKAGGNHSRTRLLELIAVGMEWESTRQVVTFLDRMRRERRDMGEINAVLADYSDRMSKKRQKNT